MQDDQQWAGFGMLRPIGEPIDDDEIAIRKFQWFGAKF